MLIMNENIRIYLHLAMIFAQHNCSSHNICCVIFRMRHYFLLDNQTFNTMFITRVHLLRRDVKIRATFHYLICAYFPRI